MIIDGVFGYEGVIHVIGCFGLDSFMVMIAVAFVVDGGGGIAATVIAAAIAVRGVGIITITCHAPHTSTRTTILIT